jgi:hypothetical protein
VASDPWERWNQYRQPAWRQRAADLLPIAATRPISMVSLPRPTSYSEEAMWEYSMRVRAAEVEPPTVPYFPILTWCAVGGDHALYQLRQYPLDDPALVYPEASQLRPLSEKYRRWIEEGSDPPPGRAVELQDGRVTVLDGHHRATALREAGHRTIQLWVGPSFSGPNQFDASLTVWVGLTHRDAVALAVRAGRAVPDEVLADYPDPADSSRPSAEQLRADRDPRAFGLPAGFLGTSQVAVALGLTRRQVAELCERGTFEAFHLEHDAWCVDIDSFNEHVQRHHPDAPSYDEFVARRRQERLEQIHATHSSPDQHMPVDQRLPLGPRP